MASKSSNCSCQSRSRPPLHFFEGTYKGISVDYLNLISKRAGFQVKYVSGIPWPKALEDIKNHEEIDLLLTAKKTEEPQKFIAFTDYYLFMPWVIFTRTDSEFIGGMQDLRTKTVSVENGYVMHHKLRDEFPGINLLVVKSSKDAIKAVASGRADAHIGNLTITTYIIQNNNLNNIKVAAPTPFGNHNQAMGIRNDWPELASIINKTLESLSPEEHAVIRHRWLTLRYEYGISKVDILKWMIAISIFSLIIIGVILFWNRKLKKEVLKRQKSEEKYRSIFENAIEGFFQSTPEGRFISVNPAFVEMFGYASSEELTSNIFDINKQYFVNNETRRQYNQILEKDGFVEQFEFRAKCKDGSHIWVSNSTRVIYDQNGKIGRYEGNVIDITKRKQAEKQLQFDHSHLMSILEAIPNGVYIVDQHFNIQYINPVIERDFGTIKGRKCYQYFHERTEVCPWCKNKEVFAGRSVTWEWHSSKTDKHFELFDTPFKNPDGSISKLEIFHDITDRKTAEETTKEQARILDLIFAHSLDSIVLLDKDYNFIRVNETYAKACQRDISEFSGHNHFEFYPSNFKDEADDVKKGKYIYQKSARPFTFPDHPEWGTTYWDLGLVPILDKEGEIELLLFTLKDVTNLKQEERALNKSEKQFQDLFNSITDLIYTQDLDGYFTSANPAMQRLFGYDMNEFIGYSAADFMEPELQHGFKDRYLEVIKKQRFHEGISCYFKKNKEKIYIEYQSFLVEPDDGEHYISGIGRDVTEKILSEKKVKKLQEQIVQSQKMESIGTLAGGIAHDFNNILFPIVGHTEMLLEDVPEDSPFREGLNQIYTAALRASELVKQILTFSRQKNGELKLMKLQPIIKEALKLIRSSIPATIKIKQDIQAKCGVVKADPTQIHQIIMNLATNAYHAMEEAGGELNVSLKEIQLGEYDVIAPEMTSGSYACLTITDTGKGMNKELIGKIFDPFFTTKKKGKGTGMGLSVVHGIVKGIGGTIQVYSELGKGTEFKIYFPVEKSSFNKQSTQIHEVIQGGIERILLIDDEDAIITMEKMMLERLGYHVTSFTSSIEALEAFHAAPEKFDLVITDMAMPNLPGDKLAVELTKIRPDIPILLCTGFSETMSEGEATSLGIKGFLLKPIVMKDLSHKIREVLDENINGKLF